MPQKRVMGCAAAAAAVVGGCQLASTFVTPTALGASSGERAALRGAVASERPASLADGAAPLASWATAAVALAAVGRAAAGRTARRAEPVSAAAAAAAAAKAAGTAAGGAKAAAAGKAASAAKAATQTGAATAGAGGAGSLTKGDGETVAGKVPEEPRFDPASQLGVTQPLGYFDPAGFCKVGDAQGFRNLRVAEIKHGRVAMMAALGAVVQHYVKFPGFDDVPSGLSAAITAPGSYGFVALFTVAGILELAVWTEDASKEPGNFGDPVGLNMYTEDMRNKELNNGRMAMFAAMGIIAGELATGKDGIEQLGL